jgi:hypothetical protein
MRILGEAIALTLVFIAFVLMVITRVFLFLSVYAGVFFLGYFAVKWLME